MKKKLLAIIVMGTLAIPAFAQHDSFFNYGSESNNNGPATRTGTGYEISTYENSGFGIKPMDDASDAPVGSGLLLLVGAGLGYAFLKRKEETK